MVEAERVESGLAGSWVGDGGVAFGAVALAFLEDDAYGCGGGPVGFLVPGGRGVADGDGFVVVKDGGDAVPGHAEGPHGPAPTADPTSSSARSAIRVVHPCTARNPSRPPPHEEQTERRNLPICAATWTTDATRGRARFYCGNTCRGRAHRLRTHTTNTPTWDPIAAAYRLGHTDARRTRINELGQLRRRAQLLTNNLHRLQRPMPPAERTRSTRAFTATLDRLADDLTHLHNRQRIGLLDLR